MFRPNSGISPIECNSRRIAAAQSEELTVRGSLSGEMNWAAATPSGHTVVGYTVLNLQRPREYGFDRSIVCGFILYPSVVCFCSGSSVNSTTDIEGIGRKKWG